MLASPVQSFWINSILHFVCQSTDLPVDFVWVGTMVPVAVSRGTMLGTIGCISFCPLMSYHNCSI